MADMRRKRAKRLAGGARNSTTSDVVPRPKRPVFVGDNIQNAQHHDGHGAVANPKPEATSKAKKLLQAQQDSVAMLTLVRERVEEKISPVLMELYEKQGYCHVDDFLENDDILSQLVREGEMLLEKGEMQADVSNLGSGEYFCSLKGGQEQYSICPRSIEFVVSTTKHFPLPTSSLPLDSGNCMAEMRTFDRKALQASIALLSGDEKEMATPERPFRGSNENPKDENRRVSLRYYLVPDGWSECGGDLTFIQPQVRQGAEVTPTTTTTIHAKRDRLVLWKSSEVMYRPEPWAGSDTLPPKASCIELHLLVEKR